MTRSYAIPLCCHVFKKDFWELKIIQSATWKEAPTPKAGMSWFLSQTAPSTPPSSRGESSALSRESSTATLTQLPRRLSGDGHSHVSLRAASLRRAGQKRLPPPGEAPPPGPAWAASPPARPTAAGPSTRASPAALEAKKQKK